jgi:ribokinase
VVLTKDGQWDIPAFRVNPVDTTGAGDAFVGNLAHALDTGQSLLEAARFASAAAAASVQRLGAQPSMPTRRESEAVLGSRPL